MVILFHLKRPDISHFKDVMLIMAFNLRGNSPQVNIDIEMFMQNSRETPYKNGVGGAMFISGLINIEY